MRPGRWRLTWRTPAMSAPSFWYFATERELADAIGRLSPLAVVSFARIAYRGPTS